MLDSESSAPDVIELSPGNEKSNRKSRLIVTGRHTDNADGRRSRGRVRLACDQPRSAPQKATSARRSSPRPTRLRPLFAGSPRTGRPMCAIRPR